MKKLLSLLLALSLSVSLCTFSAFAEEVPGADALPAAPPADGDAAPDAGMDLPAVPPAGDAGLDGAMGVAPAAPDGSDGPDAPDGPEGQEGELELDENGQVPFDPEAPAVVIEPDNSQITEEILHQPAAMPTEELLPQVDSAMGVAPAAMPVVLAAEPDITVEMQEALGLAPYTHWIKSPDYAIFGGAGLYIGDSENAWYTYCVDFDKKYPHTGMNVINYPFEELKGTGATGHTGATADPSLCWTVSDGLPLYRSADIGRLADTQEVLAKLLTAGYPYESVAAVKAVADQEALPASVRAMYTQEAIWAVTTGETEKHFVGAAPYVTALYDYATAGTVGGVPVTAPEKILVEGADSQGQIVLNQTGDSQWTGTLTISAVPEGLKLAAISGDITVAAPDGTVLRAGDDVTVNTLILSTENADTKGAVQFAYNIRQAVGTDLTLFETDASMIFGLESKGDFPLLKNCLPLQSMLGYQVLDDYDELTVPLVLGVNQPAPEPEPEPNPEPAPEPEPPAPPAPPAPAPDGDRDDDEGYDDDRPAPPADLPDQAPPLAELPGETPVPGAEAPATEDLADPEVPLAQAPETGDAAWLFAATAVLSGAGLLWLALSRRKRTEQE